MTSVVLTPGRVTVWQKYFRNGISGIMKVYFVVCSNDVFSGVFFVYSSNAMAVLHYYLVDIKKAGPKPRS
jgi:hypothetical protein